MSLNVTNTYELPFSVVKNPTVKYDCCNQGSKTDSGLSPENVNEKQRCERTLTTETASAAISSFLDRCSTMAAVQQSPSILLVVRIRSLELEKVFQ